MSKSCHREVRCKLYIWFLAKGKERNVHLARNILILAVLLHFEVSSFKIINTIHIKLMHVSLALPNEYRYNQNI